MKIDDDSFVSDSVESVSSSNESNQGPTGDDKIAADNDSPLSQGASQDVSRWRMAVLLMLTMTATIVLFSTYVFLSQAEQAVFESAVRLLNPRLHVSQQK